MWHRQILRLLPLRGLQLRQLLPAMQLLPPTLQYPVWLLSKEMQRAQVRRSSQQMQFPPTHRASPPQLHLSADSEEYFTLNHTDPIRFLIKKRDEICTVENQEK